MGNPIEEGGVNVSIKNHIASIEFHHPLSNSLPGKVLQELAKTITEMGNNDEVTVGIIIGEKNLYNLGIGTQALKKLIGYLKTEKVNSIIAYVSKKNFKSIFFFKKNGFYLINKKKYFLKIKRNTYFIFKLDI